MKKNKIFKALGVGAVATLGLFTFAGCSLSDTEKADVMKGLENANTYMEETIDLLRDQNRKLNEQNQELNEQNSILRDQNESLEIYLDEFQKENAKITAEEAWNIMLMAENKFLINYNGIRNNIKIISQYANGSERGEMICEYYQSRNNGYVSNLIEKYTDHNVGLLTYEHNNQVYGYEKDMDDSLDYKKRVLDNYDSSETYAMSGKILRSENVLFDTSYLSSSNILSVEILENGNYNIIIAFAEESGSTEYNYLLQYEITKDYDFVRFVHNCYSLKEGDSNQKSGEKSSVLVTFEYNILTEEYIESMVQEAINKSETSQD